MAAGAMLTTRARPAAWRPPGGWLLLPLALLLGSNRGGAGACPQPGSMPQPRRVPQEVKDELLEGVSAQLAAQGAAANGMMVRGVTIEQVEYLVERERLAWLEEEVGSNGTHRSLSRFPNGVDMFYLEPHRWAACANRVVFPDQDLLTAQLMVCDGSFSADPAQPSGASRLNATAGAAVVNVTWTTEAPCRRGWQTKAAIHGSRADKNGGRRDKGRKAEKVKLWCPKHTVYEALGNATLGGIEAPQAPPAAAALPAAAAPPAVDVFLATKTFLGEHHGRVEPALEEVHLRYDAGSGYAFHRFLEYKLWARVIVEYISRDMEAGARPMPVADMACGFGWLGLLAAASVNNTHVYFSELKEEYVQLARKNMAFNGLEGRGTYAVGDMWEAYKGLADADGRQVRFKHLYFYPPQVKVESIEDLQGHDQQEVDATIVPDGEDGFYFFARFLEEFREYLLPGGTAWIGIDAGNESKLFQGLRDIGETVEGLQVKRWDTRYMEGTPDMDPGAPVTENGDVAFRSPGRPLKLSEVQVSALIAVTVP